MGTWDRDVENNVTGQVPGIASGGGQGTSRKGLRGTQAETFARKWGAPLTGINYRCLPPTIRTIFECHDALEGISRIAETCFRNFQLTARRPSHMDPPFVTSSRIHGFGTVVLNSFFPNYQPLFTFTTPAQTRGVVAEIGQALPSEGLFASISWRIMLGGQIFAPYGDIRNHLWNMVGPTRLCDPIRLKGDQTFTLLAAIIPPLPPPVNVTFQVCGWTYPVRAETGDNIKSTLTD